MRVSERRLAVVVLSWNACDDVLACLETLRAATGPGDAVVVVDNGSSDGTEAAVRDEHAWVELIQNGENLGFAGGNNPGLRWALDRGYAWILLLNSDTLVPPDALDGLLRHVAERPDLGAAQPLLVRADDPGTVDSAGIALGRSPGARDVLMGEPIARAPRAPCEVFGACGAAALVRADVVREAGLLDDALFVLFEDVDWMFRIRSTGANVELVPSVRVRHARGVSGGCRDRAASRRRRFWLQRNKVALALRYWPLRALVLSSPLLAYRALAALVLGRAALGHRCWRLWLSSLAHRASARRAMRRHGLDVWFGTAEMTSSEPANTEAASSGPDSSEPAEAAAVGAAGSER